MAFKPSELAFIIPARAGSKRLKHKNRSLVGGVSLVERTYLTLKNLDLVTSAIFTTDDQFLHQEAKKIGLFSPELRPAELCGDRSSTLSVLQYSINVHKDLHGVVPEFTLLLQITSPFRYGWRIYDALCRISKDQSFNSIFSASYSDCKSFKTMSEKYKLTVLNTPLKPESYIDANGNFYVVRTSRLLTEKTVFPSEIGALITSEEEAIDIDTEKDLLKAERKAAQMCI